jgi:hypothetical protein
MVKNLVVLVAGITVLALLAVPALQAEEKAAAPAAVPELAPETDIENLKAIQGEVASVDAKGNSVTIKDPGNADPKTNVTTLIIDPKTTTIWGEFDEIKLSDLTPGTKVAGEYKINPDKTTTATYLEIVTEEEAEAPAAEDAVPSPVTPEKPVE